MDAIKGSRTHFSDFWGNRRNAAKLKLIIFPAFKERLGMTQTETYRGAETNMLSLCSDLSHLTHLFCLREASSLPSPNLNSEKFLSGFSQFSHTFNLWQKWVMTSFNKKKKPWQAYSAHRRISFLWRWGFPLCRRVSVWWGFNRKRSCWNWMQTGIVVRWPGFDMDPTQQLWSNRPSSSSPWGLTECLWRLLYSPDTQSNKLQPITEGKYTFSCLHPLKVKMYVHIVFVFEILYYVYTTVSYSFCMLILIWS